jgi:hypothetical protein
MIVRANVKKKNMNQLFSCIYMKTIRIINMKKIIYKKL